MQELFRLNIYFRKYAGKMMAGILFIILSNVSSVYVPVFVRQGIDNASWYMRLEGSGKTNPFYGYAIQAALFAGFLILLASAIRGVFMYLMRQKIIVVSREIEFDLKNDIYSHYQKLDTAFYRKNFTGDMMARIGEDVSNVRMYVGPAIMYFVNIIFTFVTVLYQMFSVNPTLSLYVLLPMPLLSYSIYKVSILINRRTTAIQAKLSEVTTYAQETFAGIRVIKSFGAEADFIRGFEKEGQHYRRLNLKLALVNSLFFPLMLLLIGLSSLVVLYLGGIEVSRGRFTAGNIAEFMIYLNMLIWPVASLGWTTALVQRAAASQKRINQFLETAPETDNTGVNPFHFEDEIRFEEVSFSYERSTQAALSHINLRIPKGKIIGITGKTGSGKSTLIQLMMRHYQPDKGQILVDGVPLDSISLNDFRNHAAYVPQDVFLFSESIRDNIAFGQPDGQVSDTRIREVTEMAGLTEDLKHLPEGLNTLLGERGVTLSGGQKQRVSIARAMIRDAGLYIFDDCLSAVDVKTEMHILQAFKNRLKGKTALIISHRVAPLSVADEIVVLKDGKIAEQGTRDELIALGGEFASIYQIQAKEATSLID